MKAVASSAPFRVPHVRTPRLLLREMRLGDFDDFANNLADPLATFHIEGVKDRRTAWRVLAAGTGFWMLHGAGWWGIELVETGKLVGTVGAFFRETSPELELGWTVYRPHWGNGYASEAARGALEYGLEAHARRRAIALISAENQPSVRVSEKIGMRFDRDIELYGERVGRYVIERGADAGGWP